MKERLIKFLAHLGVGQNKFEEEVGLSRGFVNKIGDSIREKSMKKILSKHPELNKNWLLTGEGEMLKVQHRSDSIRIAGGNNSNIGNVNTNIGSTIGIAEEPDDRYYKVEVSALREEVKRLLAEREEREAYIKTLRDRIDLLTDKIIGLKE
jgi:hypothetical protein